MRTLGSVMAGGVGSVARGQVQESEAGKERATESVVQKLYPLCMLMVTDSGRQNGAQERGGGGQPAEAWIAIQRANRFPLCLAAASAFSPNFVANLRATKSAPFDFTLIRCRCRAVDEADLSSTYEASLKKDFIFRAARHSSLPLSLRSTSPPLRFFPSAIQRRGARLNELRGIRFIPIELRN